MFNVALVVSPSLSVIVAVQRDQIVRRQRLRLVGIGRRMHHGTDLVKGDHAGRVHLHGEHQVRLDPAVRPSIVPALFTRLTTWPVAVSTRPEAPPAVPSAYVIVPAPSAP